VRVAYEHDVFISYSSADRPWAQKLAHDLGQRGLKAFYDRESLQLGQLWKDQLKTALASSNHLVCLWSAKAKGSDWVGYELFRFSAMLEEAGNAGRLMLFVNLDSTPNIYSDFQQISETALSAAYLAGLPTLPEPDWRSMADRIEAAVRRDPNQLSIPIALLTLTRPLADEIAPKKLAKIAERLSLDPATIAERYGDTRLDWRPFGDAATIATLLDEVRKGLNGRLAPRNVQWAWPAESFWDWNDGAPAQAFATAMQKRHLGVILVDPVALADDMVQQRVGMFTECLREENVAIIVVPPFAASAQAMGFRRWVRDSAAAIVKSYFEPPLDTGTHYKVRCGIGLDDVNEIQRLLQTSVGQFMRAGRPEHVPATSFTGN
jgi:hypothetical protein